MQTNAAGNPGRRLREIKLREKLFRDYAPQLICILLFIFTISRFFSQVRQKAYFFPWRPWRLSEKYFFSEGRPFRDV
jgi:hypothetical protein